MKQFTRITLDPEVMGGKPCIRGMRVTVGMIVGLFSAGYSTDKILKAYPYLEAGDIQEALAFAAWRVEEIEVSLIHKRQPNSKRQSPNPPPVWSVGKPKQTKPSSTPLHEADH